MCEVKLKSNQGCDKVIKQLGICKTCNEDKQSSRKERKSTNMEKKPNTRKAGLMINEEPSFPYFKGVIMN